MPIEWGHRSGPRPGEGELVEIPPGELDTLTTALERVWKQYEGTDTWVAFGTAIGLMFADIESVVAQMEPQRYVATAGGVWLEQIADDIGMQRSGWTDDDDLRLAIIGEALSQVTTGAPDEIIDLAVRLAPSPAVVRYREGVASFVLTIADLDPGRFALIASIMADMPPAGVGAYIETYDSTLVAGWSYAAAPPTPFGSWSFGGVTAGIRSLWSYSQRIG